MASILLISYGKACKRFSTAHIFLENEENKFFFFIVDTHRQKCTFMAHIFEKFFLSLSILHKAAYEIVLLHTCSKEVSLL